MNTALFMLRAIQLGLSIKDLEELEEGFVLDMMAERSNDNETYADLPTQADFDRF